MRHDLVGALVGQRGEGWLGDELVERVEEAEVARGADRRERGLAPRALRGRELVVDDRGGAVGAGGRSGVGGFGEQPLAQHLGVAGLAELPADPLELPTQLVDAPRCEELAVGRERGAEPPAGHAHVVDALGVAGAHATVGVVQPGAVLEEVAEGQVARRGPARALRNAAERGAPTLGVDGAGQLRTASCGGRTGPEQAGLEQVEHLRGARDQLDLPLSPRPARGRRSAVGGSLGADPFRAEGLGGDVVVAQHRQDDAAVAEQGELHPLVADPGDGTERVVAGLRSHQLLQRAGHAVAVGAEGQPHLLLAIGRHGELEVPPRVVAAVSPAQGDRARRQPEVGRVEVDRVERDRAGGTGGDDAGDAVERMARWPRRRRRTCAPARRPAPVPWSIIAASPAARSAA